MRKKISVFLMAICCIQFISASAYAADLKMVETYAESSGIEVMSTDKIVKKYRLNNGKLQYRRWNETKKCWVDSKWIDVN